MLFIRCKIKNQDFNIVTLSIIILFCAKYLEKCFYFNSFCALIMNFSNKHEISGILVLQYIHYTLKFSIIIVFHINYVISVSQLIFSKTHSLCYKKKKYNAHFLSESARVKSSRPGASQPASFYVCKDF